MPHLFTIPLVQKIGISRQGPQLMFIGDNTLIGNLKKLCPFIMHWKSFLIIQQPDIFDFENKGITIVKIVFSLEVLAVLQVRGSLLLSLSWIDLHYFFIQSVFERAIRSREWKFHTSIFTSSSIYKETFQSKLFCLNKIKRGETFWR